MSQHKRELRVSKVDAEGYIIESEVGQGSYGCVYKATDKMNQECCVKAIDMDKMNIMQRIETLNEITIMAECKHPYIINYIHDFVVDNFLCVVMTFASKGDLSGEISECVKRRTFLEEQRVMKWVAQMSLALKYLHGKRIIHRDLKNQNMMLMENDDLVLGDFGFSKILSNTLAMCQTQIGTPYYLSPEVAQNKPYSFASDLWSMGIVIFELMTLKKPFNGQGLEQLIKNIINSRLPSFSPSQNRYISLQPIVTGLLQKKPVSRLKIKVVLRTPCVWNTLRLLVEANPGLKTEVENIAEEEDMSKKKSPPTRRVPSESPSYRRNNFQSQSPTPRPLETKGIKRSTRGKATPIQSKNPADPLQCAGAPKKPFRKESTLRISQLSTKELSESIADAQATGNGANRTIRTTGIILERICEGQTNANTE